MASILIVENDVTTALEIQRVLEQFGHHVVAYVARGTEAIAIVEQTRVDLILMDIGLSGSLDGIATAAQLRDRDIQTPIIFLTTYTGVDTFQRAIATDPFGYLVKPLNMTELHSMVAIALYRYQLECQLKQDVTAQQQAEIRSREFRALVEHSPDVIARFDRQLRYRYINPSMQKATGIPSRAFIGRTNADLYMPADVVLPWNFALTQALITAREQSTEFDLVTTDGVRSYQVRIVPELNEQNIVESVLSIARDVTDYKQAEIRLRQQANREAILGDIIQRIHRSLDLQDILESAVRDIRHWLKTDRVVIYQFEPDWSGHVIMESVGEGWPPMAGQVIYDPCLVKEACIAPYRQGEIGNTPDIHQANFEDCYVELLDQYAIQANLVIPILLNQDLWGLLAVQHCQSPRHWQAQDIELLQQVSAQMAIAIHQSQLYQETQWQAQRAQSLNRLLQEIRNLLDIEQVFEGTVQDVGQLLQVEQVCLMQFQPEHRRWQNRAGYSCDPEKFPIYVGLEILNEDNRVVQQLSQGQWVTISDIHSLDGDLSHVLAETYPGVWLIVPISIQHRVWGCVHLFKAASPFQWKDWQLEFMQIVVSQLEIAIQQSSLYKQVRQLNTTLEQQVQDRTFELQQAIAYESTLKRISDRIRDSLDEDQILQTVVTELAIAVDASVCDVAVYDLEQQTSTICYEYSTTVSPFQGRRIQMADFPEGYQQLLAGQFFQFCPRLSERQEPKFARLACPIVDDQGVLGDMWLIKQSDDLFPEAQLRLVQLVANQCAIALRQSRLYKATQEQVEELARLNQLKDDFLSTVSHELRTPMASIKMALHMLRIVLEPMGVFVDEQSPVQRYFKILQDECRRETTLINDLLNLSQLESGKRPLTLSTIQVESWLLPILQPFEEQCRHHQQTLTVQCADALPSLQTDVPYLERVLTELLTNACKYTPAQGHIQVTVQSTNWGMQLQVRNSSHEIPHDELERIFDKFYRIPQRDRWQYGGTGLGLALVKQIIVDLHGTVSVSSNQDWTTFTIQIPWQIDH